MQNHSFHPLIYSLNGYSANLKITRGLMTVSKVKVNHMAASQTPHVAPWFSQMALQVRKEHRGGAGQTMMKILARGNQDCARKLGQFVLCSSVSLQHCRNFHHEKI